MHKKIFISLLITAAALGRAATLQPEAGLSYVHITGARYETNPDPTIISEDHHAWAPYIGLRSRLSSRIDLRLTYQYVSDLETRAVYAVPPGGRPGDPKILLVTPAKYNDDIHLVSFGPQFHFKPAPSLTAVISPEVNWVYSQGSIQYWETPPKSRNTSKATFGGSLALNYAVNPHWALEIRYRWTDASPSWNRQLHSFSGGAVLTF